MKRYVHRLLITSVIAIAIIVGAASLMNISQAAPLDPDIPTGLDNALKNSPNRIYHGMIGVNGSRTGGGMGGQHVLRATTQGENNRLQLSIYYPLSSGKTAGSRGTIAVPATNSKCAFNIGGRLQVKVSGDGFVYDVGLKPPYKKDFIRSELRYYPYATTTANGNPTTRYRLQDTGTRVLKLDNKNRRGESAVCKNFSGETAPQKTWTQECADFDTYNPKRCKGGKTSGGDPVWTGGSPKQTEDARAVASASVKGDDQELVRVPNAGGGSTVYNSPYNVNTKIEGKSFYPVLSYDSDTNMLKGTLTMELVGRDGLDSGDEKAKWLKLQSTDGGYITYREETGDNGRAYGVNVAGGSAEGTKVVIPFGLPCSATRPQPGKWLTIYDPETGKNPGFGPSYVRVHYVDDEGKSGWLKPGDGITTIRNTSVYNSAKGIWALSGGNKDYARLGMTLQPGYRYAMVFSNPKSANASPVGNTISFAVPTDSIGGIVNCNYNLTPSITLNGKAGISTFTPSANLNPQGVVSKSDDSGVTGNHEWRVTKIEFDGRPALSTTMKDNGDDPCGYLASQKGSASIVDSCGVQRSSPDYPGTSTWNSAGATGDIPMGHYVCYMTSVNKPTRQSSAGTWRHSVPACAVSGKQPKVHITSHDLRAGRGINTSATTIDGKLYRSWGEYGVFSNGCNQAGKMTSGSVAHNSGNPSDMLDALNHPLTFANVARAGCTGVGNYGGLPDANVEAYKQGKTEDGSSVVNGVKEISSISGDVKKVYYYPNATVHITGDLAYGDSYTAINKIPRVIIIAKNIVIGSNVGQIDAWLLARKADDGTGGRISTCMTKATADNPDNFSYQKGIANLTTGMCSKALKLNGPVVADEVYLLRTHGSGKDEEGEAAETFNLRADAFLSTYSGALGQPVATTDDIDELPPRF